MLPIRRRARLVLPLTLLALTACGTTVPLSQQVGPGTQTDSVGGLGAPSGVPTGPGGVAPAGGISGPGQPAAQGGSGAVPGVGASSGNRPGSSPGSAPVGSQAVDRSPIKVGVFHLNGGNEV